MRQPTSHNASRAAKRTLLGLLILVFVGVGNAAFAERRAVQSRTQSARSSNTSSHSGSRQAVPRSSSVSRGSRSSSGSSSRSSSPGSSAHRRTGTSGRHSSRGHYRPYYRGYYGGYYGYSSYYGYGYGFHGYYGYPLYGYWPAYSPYSYYPRYGGYVVADAAQAGRPVPIGAIDLNVKPKKAQVFVDGRYVGLIKNFDGFPNYLWLQRGSYELTFYLPGYENLVRRIDVIPGEVITFQDRLQAGVAKLPEARSDVREPAARRQRPARRAAPEGAESDITDLRSEPASLDLRVRPADASVYLDGRFLGSGRELSNLRAPLIIDSGEHVLQVVHPDFATERREFAAEPGEDVDLEVELGASSGNAE